MLIDERSGLLCPLYATDSVASSIAPPTDSYLAPSGNGVFVIQESAGGETPLGVNLFPVSVGVATDTYTLAVYGWSKVVSRKTTPGFRPYWHPYFISSYTCTAGALTGLANTDIDNTHLYAGTIVVVKGTAGYDYVIHSPTGNDNAWIKQYIHGASVISVLMALGTTPTAMNCLAKTF